MPTDLCVFVISLSACLVWYTIVELIFMKRVNLNKLTQGVLLIGGPVIIIPTIILLLGK